MSKYVLPAEKIIQGMGEWLTVAMNDHIAAKKAVVTKDEEQHQAALMVGHAYTFALKAAHDAIFSEVSIPERVAMKLDTPEKRVIYFAQQMIKEAGGAKPVTSSQLDLPHIHQ